jgi:RimJ/RimL family protein N-acetyltransferase
MMTKKSNFLIETERIGLRQMNAGDSKFILELVNTPGWLQFIGDRDIQTNNQAADYIEYRLNQSFRDHGFGYMVGIKKKDGIPVGICGILKRNYLESPDIGFALLPQYEDQGFAYEMSKSTLEYSRKTLHLPQLCGITLENNVKSIKLLEKMGMSLQYKITDSDEELLIYSHIS